MLCFDRTGTRLLVVQPDAVTVVDAAVRRTTRRSVFADAHAVAGFEDQLWIATRDDQLVRTDLDGRALGAPVALPFAGRGQLAPAPCGPAAAVWSSAPPVALIDDFGRLASSELGDVDLAIPLTGRRCVAVRGSRVTLPSGRMVRLPPSAMVLGPA